MTGALILAAGALGTPSLTFTGDTDNGIYYVGTNHFAIVGGGSPALDINGTVVTAPGSFAVVGASTFTGAIASNGKLTSAAATTGGAGLNIPPGVAPTSPVNGDLWMTSAGLFARIAGVTVQPLVAQNNLSDLASLSTTLANLGLTQSLAQPGYVKLPGGLILQWQGNSTSSGTANPNAAVTWPIAFPNNCFAAFACVSGNGGSGFTAEVFSFTTTTGNFTLGTAAGGPSNGVGFCWFAIGN